MKQKIVIIGAGMAGCFMGICLAKQGFEVEVYEEREDIRKVPIDSGRSFNLTLYYRGILAMRKIDVWERIKKHAVLAHGNVAHYANNKMVFSPFDSHGNEVLYTIHRNQLNGELLNALEEFPGAKVFFNTQCTGIDVAEKVIGFKKESKEFEVHAHVVIGADGVNSSVRSEIQKSMPGELDMHNEDWGYKEVHVSRDIAEKLNLKQLSTHTWPRPESLLIAFPNPDKSFTLMFNLPLTGKNSFASLTTEDAIKDYISNTFMQLFPLLPGIISSFLNNTTGKFVTVKTSPWYYNDFMVLIGDSAHGVIPFYGQGSCAAFDDCLTISKLIEKHEDNWEKIFKEYQSDRKINTDILADLSKENFIELRDKSRSPYFILKDKADTFLNRLFPSFWLPPLYMLIAHDSLPYSDAIKKRKKQEKIAKWSGLNLVLSVLSIPLKKSGDAGFIR